MIRVLVELAGANPALGVAELAGALESLDGRLPEAPAETFPVAEAEVPDLAAARALGHRLALARRIVLPMGGAPGLGPPRPSSEGSSASFRPLASRAGDPLSPQVERWIGEWKRSGGKIDLERPDHRFLYRFGPDGPELLGEELGRIDRRSLNARRMPLLPFRRPVSLAPRLGRALVNLAAIRAGERVVDPFLGTGSLLAESALLGARVVGIDRDPSMVRGALQNFAHLGCEAERLVVADAASAATSASGGPIDALVTDPPYGRASGSDGEAPSALVARTLAAWAERLSEGGRIAIAGPAGADRPPPGWRCTVDVTDRVHRSLTRHFRVYRRGGAGVPAPDRTS